MSTEIVKVSEVKLPKFVEQAYDTIDGMKQFAGMLLDSKLVPDHFYEKGADNKPDYTKGKVPAVVVVLLQAQQLAIPPMTALQHVIPVNGLLSIKGDLAKTMIFASGKLKKDSWVETVTGTIEDENMVVSITATREDNGITMTRTFSVDKAKRMGLWITSAQVNSTDGWKWKKSAWYKTPDRMIMYRCLGNIARDLFSDVLLNMYTTEEAVDIQRETSETIETESGAKITIPDKEHSKARSTKMTDRVADKIPENKFGEIKKDTITEAVIVPETPEKKETQPTFKEQMDALETTGKDKDESPFIPSKSSAEFMNGVAVIRDASGAITNMDEINGKAPETKPEEPGHYTLAGMEKMETDALKAIVMADTDMMEASEIIGGKNTNKKMREIIFAHQNGGLEEYVKPYIKADDIAKSQEQPGEVVFTLPDPAKGEIPLNKDFDNQGPEGTPIAKNQDILTADKPKAEVGNKYGIEITPETPRDFSIVKALFNKTMGVTPQITTPRYMKLSQKLGFFMQYPDKEQFCKLASVEEFNLLLNTN